MKKVLSILAAIALMSLGGLSPANAFDLLTPNFFGTTPSSATSQKPSPVRVTVGSWSESYQLGKDYWVYKPEAGKRFVITTVTITNISNERLRVENSDFELIGSDRCIYRACSFMLGGRMNLLEPDMLPQGSATGNVIFEVGRSIQPVSVAYKAPTQFPFPFPNLLGGATSSVTPPKPSPVRVTVGAWSESYRLGKGYSVYEPEAGKRFVITSVTVTNISNERLRVKNSDFELTGSDRCVYRASSFMFGDGMNLLEPDMLPQGTATGNVIFEISRTVQPVSVAYKASLFP